MAESLFSELRRIGIDEEVAAKVSISLDPDYIATKKDVLVMQEALLQHQARTDERYFELKTEMIRGFADLKADIADVRTEVAGGKAELRAEVADVRSDVANVRSEVGSMHRQYWITFGGLITTILTVFAVNWYFHNI